MIRVERLYLGLLPLIGALAGCSGKCQAVRHGLGGRSADTVAIARLGRNCTVDVYETAAKDSVGPKPH
jgi:hypothetical protein